MFPSLQKHLEWLLPPERNHLHQKMSLLFYSVTEYIISAEIHVTAAEYIDTYLNNMIILRQYLRFLSSIGA